MTTQINYWEPKSRIRGDFPSDYQSLANLPFAPSTKLLPQIAVSPALFAMAAMETGYGKSTDWNDFVHFPRTHRAALGTFLSRRLDWILSSMSLANNQIVPPLFARLIEISEWGSLSYYLGQIGARLGAEAWLAGQVKRALHYGIYTCDAYIKVGAKVHSILKSGEKMTPDLLVEDKAGQWHLFEAKGGGRAYRKNAVEKGLNQLDSIVAVGPSGSCTAPKSSVCAFTTIKRPDAKSTQAIHIDLVDPPAFGDGIELHITPNVSYLRAIVLDQLVLQSLPKSRMPDLSNPRAADIRSLAAGRVYAFLPRRSAWRIKALRVLRTYEHIMRTFQDYLDSLSSTTEQISMRVGEIAASLQQRISEDDEGSQDVAVALEGMSNDDIFLNELSGFRLAVSRHLRIDELLGDVERERAVMCKSVNDVLGTDRWNIVALRCGAVFVSSK